MRVGRPRDAPPSEVDRSRPIPSSLEAVDFGRVPCDAGTSRGTGVNGLPDVNLRSWL